MPTSSPDKRSPQLISGILEGIEREQPDKFRDLPSILHGGVLAELNNLGIADRHRRPLWRAILELRWKSSLGRLQTALSSGLQRLMSRFWDRAL